MHLFSSRLLMSLIITDDALTRAETPREKTTVDFPAHLSFEAPRDLQVHEGGRDRPLHEGDVAAVQALYSEFTVFNVRRSSYRRFCIVFLAQGPEDFQAIQKKHGLKPFQEIDTRLDPMDAATRQALQDVGVPDSVLPLQILG